MVTTWDLFQLCNFITNKEQSGNSYDTDEFTRVFNETSDRHHKSKLGLPEQYNPNIPLTTQGYAVTRKVLEDLKPFVVTLGYNTSQALKFVNGVAQIPSGYSYFISMTYRKIISAPGCAVTYTDHPVEPVDEGEFSIRMGSVLTPISLDYPIVRTIDNDFFIYPETIERISFSYIKEPTQAVIATTIVDDEEVFDPVNSVESGWDDTNMYDILALILQRVGVNLRSQEIVGYGTQSEIKGT
jgi:hypothetical protein